MKRFISSCIMAAAMVVSMGAYAQQLSTRPPAPILDGTPAPATAASEEDTRTIRVDENGNVIVGNEDELRKRNETLQAENAAMQAENDDLTAKAHQLEKRALQEAGISRLHGFDIRGDQETIVGDDNRIFEAGDWFINTNLFSETGINCEQRRQLSLEELQGASDLAKQLTSSATKVAAGMHSANKDGRQTGLGSMFAFIAAESVKGRSFSLALDAMACGAASKDPVTAANEGAALPAS